MITKFLINQVGGAKSKSVNMLMILAIMTLSFVVRALIVQISYNYLTPKMAASFNITQRQITLVDAMALVILVGCLLGC
tara:strand:+ start:167 stop:403 length:237 start_codon:yes stop_codon:yes gene_type:complete